MQNKFFIMKTDDAKDLELPKYMSEGSAGMDLFANVLEPTVIAKGDIVLIPTGIRLAFESDFEAQIRPRSGLALKHGITVLNSPGTIDSDYRGEIKIPMINHGKEDYVVTRGQRIAQMVFHRIERVKLVETDHFDETERGFNGFGSTGV